MNRASGNFLPGAFPIFLPRPADEHLESHGQGWQGERVEENIDLCRYQTIEPALRTWLPKNGRILEAGCGLGRWVIYLKQLGYDITGIDLSETAVKAARAFDPQLPVLIDDVLHSQFPDASFDAVISLGVMEHFPEGPALALRESARLLKPSGMLFVAVPFRSFYREAFIYHIRRLRLLQWKLSGTRIGFEEYHYRRKHFQRLLEDAGFRVMTYVYDDFLPPKNMALYADSRLFHGNNKWELNAFGRTLNGLLRMFSLSLNAAGVLFVCTKATA